MEGLDAIAAEDRAWFEAHPCRRYRLRPTKLGEVLPGDAILPGSHVVVIWCTPTARLKVRVGRPPAHLRHDTDSTCRKLLRRVHRAGYTINGTPLLPAMNYLRRLFVRNDL